MASLATLPSSCGVPISRPTPSPSPSPGSHFFNIPTKTAHGVFGTPLNDVWHTVAPQIKASMKANGLQYSALKTARFSTVQDDKETFGPAVVWIAVRPDTTDARAVRDATPDILRILADAQIVDVVVEWYEGRVGRKAERPASNDRRAPHQLQVRSRSPLQHWLRHPHRQAVRRRAGHRYAPVPGGEDQQRRTQRQDPRAYQQTRRLPRHEHPLRV